MSSITECTRYQSTPEEMLDLEHKLDRLKEGQPLRVIDLFAGCGGMSLGLKRAGFTISGGIDINPKAAETHARNFFSHLPEEDFACHKTSHDIQDLPPEKFKVYISRKEPRHSIRPLVSLL